MRGRGSIAGEGHGARRTTPAGAGTRPLTSRMVAVARDYPRRCGDEPTDDPTQPPLVGLPPQVRGRVTSPPMAVSLLGTTPAGAGTSGGRRAAAYSNRVSGLPPQVRGREGPPPDRLQQRRTTPAGAGTSVQDGLAVGQLLDYPCRCGDEVDQPPPAGFVLDYPRRCGDEGHAGADDGLQSGLPPQVRGRVVRDRRGVEAPRTTPAGAGTSPGVGS